MTTINTTSIILCLLALHSCSAFLVGPRNQHVLSYPPASLVARGDAASKPKWFATVTTLKAESIGYGDIQPGDIICFTAGKNPDVVSEVITLLSGDDYSHAALVTRDNKIIVEATIPHIQTADLKDEDRFGGRVITASRLENVDLEKVQKAADRYVEEKAPYGMADLIEVGLLLIAKNPRMLFDRRVWKTAIKLLKMMPQKKDSDEEKDEGQGPAAMFCSQFVYQCYKDAGYVLEIEDPALRILTRTLAAATDDTDEDTILDVVIQKVERDELKPQPEPVPTAPSQSKEEVLQELCEALKEASEGEAVKERVAPPPETLVDDELARAVIDFALFYEEAVAGGELSRKPVADQKDVMSALNKVRAANRVTPGDLTRLANSNALRVGSIDVPEQ